LSNETHRQAILKFAYGPLRAAQLEDLVDAVLEALNRVTRPFALPVVGIDFPSKALEIEFTIRGESADDVNEAIGRVASVVHATFIEIGASPVRFEEVWRLP
jgi:hypothetical protein